MDEKTCKPCEGDVDKMKEEASRALEKLEGWKREGDAISRTYTFKNFYETIAFVNAVAWIANTEDHHPDLEVSYKNCKVTYSTHSVGGLTQNDFICAGRINRL